MSKRTTQDFLRAVPQPRFSATQMINPTAEQEEILEHDIRKACQAIRDVKQRHRILKEKTEHWGGDGNPHYTYRINHRKQPHRGSD